MIRKRLIPRVVSGRKRPLSAILGVTFCLLVSLIADSRQSIGLQADVKSREGPTIIRGNKVSSQMSIGVDALPPEEEQRGFHLPEGFEVELVAAETEGIGKFVTIAFDAKGRMWSMTALEYPVDSNENAETSRNLFDNGGRDKVLVFDHPYGAEPSPPRVFAEGLVMPLGILPFQDGVYVQYGNDIRLYRDTNGDGKADGHSVILTGFGVQDSHLFPHQFTRTPGGWILTAQGLFNYSEVRRPDGLAFADGRESIVFNQTKLARFRPDGSLFEILTAGPNNIWGLTISREGETWLQEANDLGYPIIPYEPGGYYRTGSKEKLRSYQPLMPPPLAPPQMGGTGLSGLALADDRDGWPAPWGANGGKADSPKMFYVANPITSSIQLIRATPEDGRYRYEKLPDFLTSNDPRFRPVAIQFGPDGLLYVVDWYNKIISHNEVPRSHPDRDKTRGRIWRIRYFNQPITPPPDLTSLNDMELLKHLGAPNARVADLAWQQIVDRNLTGLSVELTQLANNRNLSADRRLGALWALEGLQTIPTRLLETLSKDSNANLRHEAVRIAAAQPRPANDFLSIAEPLVDDLEPKVRAALGDSLRRIGDPTPEVLGLMTRLGRPSLSGHGWQTYDREFERFLSRWALERNAPAVATFLQSEEGRALPLENRALATSALSGRDAALGLTTLLPYLDRPLTEEEVRILASHCEEPPVANALKQELRRSSSRESILRALLSLNPELDTSRLQDSIFKAVHDLWMDNPGISQRKFALKVAGAFHLISLEQEIAAFASDLETTINLKLASLRALREMRSNEVTPMIKIALSSGSDRNVRQEALAVLAASGNQAGHAALLGLFSKLDAEELKSPLIRLSSSKTGAESLLQAVRTGLITPRDIGIPALEKMRTWLLDNPQMEQMWSEYADQPRQVLRLNGSNLDYVREPISLQGPFTVEAWVRLESGIGNQDGILAAPGIMDMNFHDAHFRVWLGSEQCDAVIATSETLPEKWTHYAVTREKSGTLRIYINGELNAESNLQSTNNFSGLNIGRTLTNSNGTDGMLTEFRVWSKARTAIEIRDNFDRDFSDNTRSKDLIHHLTKKNWGDLNGKACLQSVLDPPDLLTTLQAAEQRRKFERYRNLADKPGDALMGKELFTAMCLPCHQQGGQGGKIAPPLDGVGHTGTEALLRNLLTPNAAMEGGYRMFRVETRDGEMLEGLLVSRNPEGVVLRQLNISDQRIPQSKIKRAEFTSSSMMPEGLLEALEPHQVMDLFTYLLSLK